MCKIKLVSLSILMILIAACSSETTDTSQGSDVTYSPGINYPECSTYTPYAQFNDDFTNRMMLLFSSPGSKEMIDAMFTYSNEDFWYVDLYGDLSTAGCQPATSEITIVDDGIQLVTTFKNTFDGQQLQSQESDSRVYKYSYVTGNVSTVGNLEKVTRDGLDCYDFGYDSDIGTLTQIDISAICAPGGVATRLSMQYADPAGRDPYIFNFYEYKDGDWNKTVYEEWTVIREANVIQSIKAISTDLTLDQTDTMTITPSYKDGDILENLAITDVFNQMNEAYTIEFLVESASWHMVDYDEGDYKNKVNFSNDQVTDTSWSSILGSGSSVYTY